MKRSLYIILPAIFAVYAGAVKALEIDEKLTLRFLKVSSTQKTVLINRGGEDGLVVGDHAKFFITAGVVARGVAEKVSPSRSVWSLYRIVDSTEITQDKVLNLKIASPVKITDDPSKSLKDEVIPGGNEMMDVQETADMPPEDKEMIVNNDDRDELRELGVDDDLNTIRDVAPKRTVTRTATRATNKKGKVVFIEKTPVEYSIRDTTKDWELFGTLSVNSLTGTVSSDDTTASENSTSASDSTVDYSAGVEKYFLTGNNFFKELSILAFLHKRTVESGDTIKSTSDWFEYGAGLNYHFYNSAATVNRLIGFFSGTIGRGTATLTSKTVSNGVGAESSIKGDDTFYTLGLGAKYVLTNGFGLRAILDYYHSNETYEYASDTTEGDTITTRRTLSGPRVQFGLSYRF